MTSDHWQEGYVVVAAVVVAVVLVQVPMVLGIVDARVRQ